MRLPSKDSATASAFRVLLYVVIPQILALLLDPQTAEVMYKYFPQIAAVITAGTPAIAFIYNFYRKDVENY